MNSTKGIPKPVVIGGRAVGPGEPVFIIAEAGVNHNGDLARAKKMVEVAADAGAHAVKFQTFRAERLVSADRGHQPPGESQFDMLRHLELSPQAHRELTSFCRALRILFLSTPFDEESSDLLESLSVPAFKLSSGDITNLPLLDHVARKAKPILLSTGMSSQDEVATAIRVVRTAQNDEVVLLHCVSNYPAQPADCNLRALHAMAAEFRVPVGYSDHTMGIEVAAAAVALGACVIEKHFTLDRGLPGPDHRASLEPEELKELVRAIGNVEAALGHGRKEPMPSEASAARVARRSLFAAKDLRMGTRLTRDLVAIKRPGTGLPPSMLSSLLGRTLRVDVRADSLLSLEHFDEPGEPSARAAGRGTVGGQ